MEHELPKLDYAYDALEPVIDAKTVELHHSKHHQSYVDGLNKANKALEEARKNKDFSLVKHLKKEIAFHGSGHILHSIYWKNMCPQNESKEKPEGELLKAIENKFGSYETFEEEFKKTTTVVEGSGWGVLAYVNGDLEILTIEKHQNLTQMGAIPLLVCDVWEHAYYLNYQNKRPEYIENFFKIVNWDDVEERFEKANQ